MPGRVRTITVEKVISDGRLLHHIERGCRKFRSRFYGPEIVPDYAGMKATFEVRRWGGKTEFLRRVDGR